MNGPGRWRLGSPESGFRRHANGLKPAADIHLGVGFAAEMAGGGAIGGGQVPLDDRELLISALNHKPADRIVTDDPANFALEFLQTRHAFSVKPMARSKISIKGKSPLGRSLHTRKLVSG